MTRERGPPPDHHEFVLRDVFEDDVGGERDGRDVVRITPSASTAARVAGPWSASCPSPTTDETAPPPSRGRRETTPPTTTPRPPPGPRDDAFFRRSARRRGGAEARTAVSLVSNAAATARRGRGARTSRSAAAGRRAGTRPRRVCAGGGAAREMETSTPMTSPRTGKHRGFFRRGRGSRDHGRTLRVRRCGRRDGVVPHGVAVRASSASRRRARDSARQPAQDRSFLFDEPAASSSSIPGIFRGRFFFFFFFFFSPHRRAQPDPRRASSREAAVGATSAPSAAPRRRRARDGGAAVRALQSAVDPTSWGELARRKLDTLGLSEDPVAVDMRSRARRTRRTAPRSWTRARSSRGRRPPATRTRPAAGACPARW